MKHLLTLAALLAVCGCTPRAELITLREGLNAAAQPAFNENIATAKRLEAAGVISEAELKIREDSKSKFDGLVKGSREEDAKAFGN